VFSKLERCTFSTKLAGLDVGHCAIRLFFADFKKGFDLVSYNIIVQELENLHVNPIIIQ
jgi:hypothetical protein